MDELLKTLRGLIGPLVVGDQTLMRTVSSGSRVSHGPLFTTAVTLQLLFIAFVLSFFLLLYQIAVTFQHQVRADSG